VADGNYDLTAIAIDAAGNTQTSAPVGITIDQDYDVVVPTVTIIKPDNGAQLMGEVELEAQASDNIGVVGVQFKLNGTNIGDELTVQPYKLTWNTASVADGNYTLSATARDAAGNTATAQISISIQQNASPTVTLLAPSAGDVWAGEQTIRWTATDPDNDTVLISLSYAPAGGGDWQAIAANIANSGSYVWDVSTIAGGMYKLKIVATDEHAAAAEVESAAFTIAKVTNESTHGPNPASNKVTFYFAPGTGGTLYVYDMAGRLVWTADISGNTQSLDWNLVSSQGRALPNGLYMYMVVQADGKRTMLQRLVIER